MKARDIQKAGVPAGPALKQALRLMGAAARAGLHKRQIMERLRQVTAEPDAFLDDPLFSPLARTLRQEAAAAAASPSERPEPAPWRAWGTDLDRAAVAQMRTACELPVAVQGALMPDAHVGYGLPIGGVLAADNAVIPYAVGVDIACRMTLTVTDLPCENLVRRRDELIRALETQTLFGAGAAFRTPHDHPAMHKDWDFCDIVRRVKDKARGQLGTSGSGNHFAEFGVFTPTELLNELPAGEYLALLSHSGSRGPGATVAEHFWRVAMKAHPRLPRQLRHLSWLSLDSDHGREYWQAMQLMGEFAAANHEIVHRKILRALKAQVRMRTQNHHNFAWKERHGGRDLVVHRKGATPAARGVPGMIPGSMASPGFLVRGKGDPASLHSAAHGAGRRMSRSEAKNRFAWPNVKKELEAAGVTLLSAGIDEAPGAYKDIFAVMRQQADLVEIVGRFDPKIVKMAGD